MSVRRVQLALIGLMLMTAGLLAAAPPAPGVEAAVPVGGVPLANGQILFVSAPSGLVPGPWSIESMDPDASGVSELASGFTYRPYARWSPDGTMIAYSVGPVPSSSSIYVMNSNGSGAAKVVDQALMSSWSPDGIKLAFTCSSIDADICVSDADGANETNLTQSYPFVEGQPEWSPDGTKIAFRVDTGSGTRIWVMGSDGSNPTVLTAKKLYATDARWSPSGSKIAFTGGYEDGEIYVMRSDGSRVRNLTDNTKQEQGPVWAPDGSKVLFAAQRKGSWKTYAIAPNGAGMTRLYGPGGVEAVPTDWAAK